LVLQVIADLAIIGQQQPLKFGLLEDAVASAPQGTAFIRSGREHLFDQQSGRRQAIEVCGFEPAVAVGTERSGSQSIN
jgi:hypothetical protein